MPSNHPRRRLPRGLGTEVAGMDLTEMLRGTEYFLSGGCDVVATSSDDEEQKTYTKIVFA